MAQNLFMYKPSDWAFLDSRLTTFERLLYFFLDKFVPPDTPVSVGFVASSIYDGERGVQGVSMDVDSLAALGVEISWIHFHGCNRAEITYKTHQRKFDSYFSRCRET
jgi:hypothetical protein